MKKAEIFKVSVNGIEMEYCKFGSGERTFVIIPGLSVKSVLASASGIAAAYRDFAGDYTVYVFDRRLELPEKYNVEQMAEDTAAVMKHIGLNNADIFGASQGGMIAQLIAAEHPELVHKLILGSTSCSVSGSAENVINRWTELAAKGLKRELFESFADNIYSEEYLSRFRELIIEFGNSADENDLKRFCVLADACRGFDISGRLESIKCPVLVIGSRKDRVLGGEASQRIAEKLGCEIYMYEGYSHSVYDEAPDYKRRMLDFLK